jgi:dTDP-4-dehydrorhamnose reductase
MTTSILLFGAYGWIGNQVLSQLKKRKDVTIVYKSTVRVDDVDEVIREIDNYNPTHVISCIGRTFGYIDNKIVPTIDYLEYPGKLVENVRDNLFAPIVLANVCTNRNIHLTYLGTGCIFEYDTLHTQTTGFTEDSKPNFFGSSYSVVKGFTDRLMSLYKDSVLNVRIRMPITAEPNSRDFITKIASYEKICSMDNSMTVLDDLVPIMVDMAITKKTGTVNLINPGVISHETILEMYREIVDPTITWQTMSYEEQSKLLKSKRSNNYLDTSLLQQWYPDVKHINTAVRDALVNRKKFIDNMFAEIDAYTGNPH